MYKYQTALKKTGCVLHSQKISDIWLMVVIYFFVFILLTFFFFLHVYLALEMPECFMGDLSWQALLGLILYFDLSFLSW